MYTADLVVTVFFIKICVQQIGYIKFLCSWKFIVSNLLFQHLTLSTCACTSPTLVDKTDMILILMEFGKNFGGVWWVGQREMLDAGGIPEVPDLSWVLREGYERVWLSLKYKVLSMLGKGQQGAFRSEERKKKSWLNNPSYRIILLFWPRVVVYFGFFIS